MHHLLKEDLKPWITQKVQNDPTTCTFATHDCEITFEGNGTLSPNEMKIFERSLKEMTKNQFLKVKC